MRLSTLSFITAVLVACPSTAVSWGNGPEKPTEAWPSTSTISIPMCKDCGHKPTWKPAKPTWMTMPKPKGMKPTSTVTASGVWASPSVALPPTTVTEIDTTTAPCSSAESSGSMESSEAMESTGPTASTEAMVMTMPPTTTAPTGTAKVASTLKASPAVSTKPSSQTNGAATNELGWGFGVGALGALVVLVVALL